MTTIANLNKQKAKLEAGIKEYNKAESLYTKTLEKLKKKLGLYSYSHGEDVLTEMENDLENVIQEIEDKEAEKGRLVKKGLLKEVYKKAYLKTNYESPVVVVLQIPAKAKRSQDVEEEYKCRASEAKVLRIENLQGKKLKVTRAMSGHDNNFKYDVGKTARPKFAFDTTGEACASGIHFFMLREDAVHY